jgi:tripartite-type tricarboxylate transporter receptor subunit TctC
VRGSRAKRRTDVDGRPANAVVPEQHGVSRRSVLPARKFLTTLFGIAIASTGIAFGAQGVAKGKGEGTYPSRPIRVLMPFPAGGTPDALGRMVATQVESQLGGSMVVDNRTGANGMIAYELGAKGNPDGYTILHATPSFALNTIVFKKLAYDLHRDFTPITNIAQGFGYLMLVHPSVQATNVKELIAYAKAQSKPLTYGTPGVGNTLHLATELFNARAGLNMLHVPYKGVAPALNALLGGEINLIILQPPAGVQQTKVGRLRAIAFTGAKRWDGMPDLPTVSESGLPGFVVHFTWNAWFAPAKTPREIVLRLQSEVKKAMQVPKVREFFISGGWEPLASTPEELGKYVDAELVRYAEAARIARIQPE